MSKSVVDVIFHASKDVVPSGVMPTLRPSQGYHQLFMALGYLAREAPVADFLRHYHGLSGVWLMASPLHWEATHNDAMVRAAGAALCLTDDESRRLFLAFSDFIEANNMRLHYHDAVTWLLQAEAYPVPDVPPVHDLLDHSMRPALQALEPTAFWLRFITESQMFFSAMASTVNGLWVWGGKAMQARPERAIIVCGDEAWLKACRGLAAHVDCFNPTRRVARGGVYFVPDPAWMNVSDLAFHLRDQHVRWHWNNMMYVSKPRSWFSRLWRR